MQRRGFLQSSVVGALVGAGVGFGADASTRLAASKIVIGFPAGGSSDTVARLVSEVLRGSWADAVVVEPRTGAGGTIAAEYVRNSPADGSVLLISPSTSFTLQPHTNLRLPYNAATDFVPVAGLAMYGAAIVVGPKVPATVRTLTQFATWAKERAAEASYGSSGAGGGAHFLGFQLFRQLGAPVVHVPYRGNQQAIADVLGGQIAAVVTGIPEIAPHVRSGKVRALAVSLPERARLLPDTPTLAELCCAHITGGTDVMGLYAPARMAASLVSQLEAIATSTAKNPSFLRAYEQMAYDARMVGSQEFSRWLAGERAAWADVVRSSGFKPES